MLFIFVSPSCSSFGIIVQINNCAPSHINFKSSWATRLIKIDWSELQHSFFTPTDSCEMDFQIISLYFSLTLSANLLKLSWRWQFLKSTKVYQHQINMARSQRNQNKEKLSRKEKLEQKKDAEKMKEQIKTVTFKLLSVFHVMLSVSLDHSDSASNIRCSFWVDCYLCYLEDPSIFCRSSRRVIALNCSPNY